MSDYCRKPKYPLMVVSVFGKYNCSSTMQSYVSLLKIVAPLVICTLVRSECAGMHIKHVRYAVNNTKGYSVEHKAQDNTSSNSNISILHRIHDYISSYNIVASRCFTLTVTILLAYTTRLKIIIIEQKPQSNIISFLKAGAIVCELCNVIRSYCTNLVIKVITTHVISLHIIIVWILGGCLLKQLVG